MLPTITLQASDSGNFAAELTAGSPLPAAASPPRIGFADLLRPMVPAVPAAEGGGPLPLPGNALPILPASVAVADGEAELLAPADGGAEAELPGAEAAMPAAAMLALPLSIPEIPWPAGTAAAASQVPVAATTPAGANPYPLQLQIAVGESPARGTAGPVALPAGTATEQRAPVPLPSVGAQPGQPAGGAGIAQQAAIAAEVPGDRALLIEALRRQDPAATPAIRNERVPAATGKPADPGSAALRELASEFRPTPSQPPQPQTVLPPAAVQPAVTAATAEPALPPQSMPLPASTAPPSSPVAAPPPQLGQPIGVAVGDPAWGDQLGERVQLLASHKLSSADIRLTPAELGPIRIRIAIDDGTASVTFTAQHALTREAIEQALPRLREMLSDNGLTLGQASVGEQGVPQERGHGDSGPGEPGYVQSAGDAAVDVTGDAGDDSARRPVAGNGLVDTFA